MREGLNVVEVRNIYNHVASRYDFLHGLLTLKSDQRGRRLLVEKAVREGNRVLDAGGGTGGTALLAARKAGASGRVTVLDLSESMLAVAKEKFERTSLSERGEFIAGDLLALPFADETFDSVLSSYSLCPVGDPLKGVYEMLRVVKRGGLVGLAYSASPANPLTKWLAHVIESVIWHFPSISMGCRAISILPRLDASKARVQSCTHLGVPLWPFEIAILEKL